MKRTEEYYDNTTGMILDRSKMPVMFLTKEEIIKRFVILTVVDLGYPSNQRYSAYTQDMVISALGQSREELSEMIGKRINQVKTVQTNKEYASLSTDINREDSKALNPKKRFFSSVNIFAMTCLLIIALTCIISALLEERGNIFLLGLAFASSAFGLASIYFGNREVNP